MMTEDMPRTENVATTVGLYIELKDYNKYLAKGIDMASMLDEVLREYDLGTIADCESTMPIIIQSFDFEALEAYQELSDLPLVQLAHYGDDYSYDWDKIGKVAHGVGPDSRLVFDTDFKSADYKKASVESGYSAFISQMHGLEMAVHPWTLRDDDLSWTSSPYDEA